MAGLTEMPRTLAELHLDSSFDFDVLSSIQLKHLSKAKDIPCEACLSRGAERADLVKALKQFSILHDEL
jgi:hypothetical protein